MRWMKSFVVVGLVLLVGCAGVRGNAVRGNAVGGNAVGGNAVGGNAVGGNAVGGNAVGGNAAKQSDLQRDVFMGEQRQVLIGNWHANGDRGETIKSINNEFNNWIAQRIEPTNQKRLTNNQTVSSATTTTRSTSLTKSNQFADNNNYNQLKSLGFGRGVRVGMLLPISGNLSHLGKSLWQAALLGVYEYSDNDNFTLLLFDTESTSEGAVKAFNQALKEEVRLIIGPVLSSSLKEISQLNQSQIPIISFSNNNQEALNKVYIFGYTPKQQLESIVSYALQKEKKAIAAILPRTLYGKAILDSLKEELNRHQLTLVDVLLYSRNDQQLEEKIKVFSHYNLRRQNLASSINAAKANNDLEMVEELEKRETYGETPFDSVLLVAGDGVDLVSVSSRLAFFDAGIRNEVQILGLQSWENFENIHREPSLVGAWYAAPPDKTRKQFENLYFKTYKQKPVRLATLSLELVLLVSLIAEDILGGVEVSDILQKETGFVGIEGAYRFLDNGKVDRIMTMMRVTDRGNVIEQQPPDSFQLFDLNRKALIESENDPSPSQ